MTLSTLLMFAVMEFVLCLYPGPAVLCIISQGMRQGAQASLRGAIGVLTGNTIYFSLSAIGLGAMLIASKTLYVTIKWIGAGYLIVIGAKMIYTTYFAPKTEEETVPPISGKRLFAQGLVTQLANPKAIVYFTALLPQFVTLEQSVPLQFLILGVLSILIELPVLALYGWLSSKGRHLFTRTGSLVWLDRCAGLLLIGAGIKLGL